MNKDQELENREFQNEEIMALEAIYPESFKADPTSPNAFVYTLNLDEEATDLKSPRICVVRFFLPPSYPNQDMPVYEISSIYCGTKKLDDDILDAIDIGFRELFQPSEVVLFEWISWLKEFLEENVEKQQLHKDTIEEISQQINGTYIEEVEGDFDYNPEDYVYKKPESAVKSNEDDDGHDRPTVRSLMGANSFDNEIPPKIFSSQPLQDRKSSFVAHVATVESIHQVKVVVAHLLQNKRIAKATHNILAYRIRLPNGKMLQDNDDDGESAAGGRLLHLMDILEVENVVVVVTRWFGGIHLGPDRFKDINNVARGALEECGYISKQKNGSVSKKTASSNKK